MTNPKKTAMDRFLDTVERAGNALPHPATLFALLALSVVVASFIATHLGVSVQHPTTGATVTPVNLLSLQGLRLGVGGQPMVLKWDLLLLKKPQGFETPWAGMVGEIHAEES